LLLPAQFGHKNCKFLPCCINAPSLVFDIMNVLHLGFYLHVDIFNRSLEGVIMYAYISVRIFVQITFILFFAIFILYFITSCSFSSQM
jgi:hypothetical protein